MIIQLAFAYSSRPLRHKSQHNNPVDRLATYNTNTSYVKRISKKSINTDRYKYYLLLLRISEFLSVLVTIILKTTGMGVLRQSDIMRERE